MTHDSFLLITALSMDTWIHGAVSPDSQACTINTLMFSCVVSCIAFYLNKGDLMHGLLDCIQY